MRYLRLFLCLIATLCLLGGRAQAEISPSPLPVSPSASSSAAATTPLPAADPPPPPVKDANPPSNFSTRAATMSKINGVRVGATSSRVRIVIDASKETKYKTMALREPGRIVIDLEGAWLDPQISRETPIGSRFASKVSVGQFDQNTVRIVVYTEVKKENYAVFGFAGGPIPYRVVMDFGKLGTAVGNEYGDESASTTTKKSDKENKSTDKTATDKEKKDNSKEKLLPIEKKYTKGLKGKIICLDPGHGGSDPGAIGPTGLTEKSITLRIALEAKKRLEAAGSKVIMTRSKDVEVSPKKEKATDIEELQARCDIANKAKTDVFICIHMDSFTSSEAAGTTGYYYAKGTISSKKLAQCIQEAVVKRLATKNRGPKGCNFYVVKHSDMPATLVEIAFLSNPKEEKLINSSTGVQKAAQGVVDGIMRFFNG